MSGEWIEYHQKTLVVPHRPLLEEVIHKVQTPIKKAVDAGCGTGADAAYLAAQGFDVVAFDSSQSAINTCRARFAESNNVKCVNHCFSTFYFPPCSLFWASQSLYFCPLENLTTFVQKALTSLLPGGVFTADFLGQRDTWVGSEEKSISFCQQSDIHNWSELYELLQIRETEEDGTTIMGQTKHWHTLTAVIRKPL
ncbi:class I SAM-dependent methyltransferase [Gilvimarinus chinensis]|uniref:class I SAM-dependent methyltransferase n=1 Tax=Gilvimarinus chinensis TaxID=396005 RepID=UPI000377BCA7|nr:class I SAM-dependent methyltransferase [Gilvimarinus chinensis]